MTETPQPKWTWSDGFDGTIGKKGRPTRTLFFGSTEHGPIPSMHAIAPNEFFDLIPQMCDDLNAAEEQRHATEPQKCPTCGLIYATPSGVGHAILCHATEHRGGK